MWRAIMAVSGAVTAAAPAIAQNIPAGTYSMPDSGYSIVIQPQGDDLRVDEAGQERVYVKAGPGTYEYQSPVTGSTYQLVYRDRASLSAIKKGSGDAPTLLVRRGGAAPIVPLGAAKPMATIDPNVALGAAAETVDAGARASAASPAVSPHLKVAERYQALTLSDKKDSQTWAFCSAAALKRSMATRDEADAYGREAAERLALISTDPARNPCPDAIPDALWPGTSDPEAEALSQANTAQLATAAQQSREIAAMREKQAADQRAYEQAQAAHQEALAKARRDQEIFAQQRAAYEAALAEHERLTKGGQRR